MATAKRVFPANKKISWTPDLVRSLRGKRTQADFGALLGVPKNTVWRWEAGHAKPDRVRAGRLFDLATREGFFKEWNLVGSVTILGDLEEASREIARLFARSQKRRRVSTG